ncbi:MAG: hypothetical protein IT388_02730 [Nitrospirales bacterium]|nr:hypothetical protein [Nitrospirales bacterium]
MRKLLCFSFYTVLLCSVAGCLFDRPTATQETISHGESSGHPAPAAGKRETVTSSFIVERPDAISDEELMRMRASYTGSEMTLNEAKTMLALHAGRKKMPENVQETMLQALDSLARHIPVKEAYKLVALRFRLSDLNEFKKNGSSDYERSIGLDGRTVFR